MTEKSRSAEGPPATRLGGIALLAIMLSPAAPGAGWDDLSREEQLLLAPLEARWPELSDARRESLRQAVGAWDALRARIVRRRLRDLPAAERARLRERLEPLTPAERRRFLNEHFAAAPP